jgi:hypothetical protein
MNWSEIKYVQISFMQFAYLNLYLRKLFAAYGDYNSYPPTILSDQKFMRSYIFKQDFENHGAVF